MASVDRDRARAALSEQRCRRDSSMSKDEENYLESDDDPADAATSDPDRRS